MPFLNADKKDAAFPEAYHLIKVGVSDSMFRLRKWRYQCVHNALRINLLFLVLIFLINVQMLSFFLIKERETFAEFPPTAGIGLEMKRSYKQAGMEV